MSATTGEEGSTNALSEAAFGAYLLLKDNLADVGITLTREEEESLVIGALNWHDGHLATIVVQQHRVDPLKLTCWFGGTLIRLFLRQSTLHSSKA